MIAFQVFSNTLMVVCVTLAFINLKSRFNYEERMFYENFENTPVAIIETNDEID